MRSNSADPLSGGAPTSSEFVKTPNVPVWTKVDADTRQRTSNARIAGFYPMREHIELSTITIP